MLIPVFQDAEFARAGWRQLWQGWVDPARIVHEHHRLRQEAVRMAKGEIVVRDKESGGEKSAEVVRRALEETSVAEAYERAGIALPRKRPRFRLLRGGRDR